MTASALGVASSGSIPASLAALLNLPPRPLAPPVPQFFGTTAVGSMFSAPIPPPPPATVVATPTILPAGPPAASSGSSPTLAILPATSGEVLPAAPPATLPATPPVASPVAVAPVAALSSAAPVADAVTPAGPFHLDNLISIRLTPDNYLFWRAKVIPTVHGPAINPEHRMWVQHDQAILSAIQGSLGNGVAGLCLFAATSMDAWTTLEHAFAQISTSRSRALRSELADIKKLDSSATTYFNKMKVLADTLTSIGRPLSDEEFAAFVIKGLDAEYDNLAEAVHNAKPAMPPHELYPCLLFTEQRVEARRSSVNIVAQPTAYWASRGQRSPAPSAGKAAPPLHRPWVGALILEWCASFVVVNDTSLPSVTVAFRGASLASTTTEKATSATWYMDTGATDHMTNELNKLSTYQPYYGHD
nr:uncharacterized protein LOC123494095 [Aegilops tauschii subsp. strangulata]